MKKNKAKYIAMIILGIASVMGAFVSYRFSLNAVGGGLMGFGMVMLIMGITRLFSDKAAKDAEIEVTDERNKAILHAAYYYSGQIVMTGLAVCVVVFAQLEDFRGTAVAGGLLVLQFVSMLIARAVLRRKM